MSTKKIPSIAEQAREGTAALDGWVRGDTRFRTTIAAKDGSRVIMEATRAELEAKLKKATVIKEIRSDLKMSQPEFAGLLHVAPGTLKGWEIARRAVPESVLALAKLARDMPEVRRRLAAKTATSAKVVV